ncbi:superoxide dismutase [Candidatus Saccharibacteria bacterium]|nr:superoxide dismutase [Candidatus Saccharibacteria bacterium]
MHTLPELPYAYNDLEPVISREVMQLHHTKHHQTYVNKLNDALKNSPELQNVELIALLENIANAPAAIQTAIRNHGGGHYNHSLFWQSMRPDGPNKPTGSLADAIQNKWGAYAAFVDEFSNDAQALFGSGWVWLMPNLTIITTPNQDNPIMLGLGEPLMGLDVWEHAYYLDYKNRRDEYIQSWWGVVNWDFIQSRYRDLL